MLVPAHGFVAPQAEVQRWSTQTRPAPHSLENWQVSEGARHSPSTHSRPPVQGAVALQPGFIVGTQEPSTQDWLAGQSIAVEQPVMQVPPRQMTPVPGHSALVVQAQVASVTRSLGVVQ
jgi:hypothetical protein